MLNDNKVWGPPSQEDQHARSNQHIIPKLKVRNYVLSRMYSLFPAQGNKSEGVMTKGARN